MKRNSRPFTLRFLSTLLAPGRGAVRAIEDAMHLQGVLRFVSLIVITIVGPSLVLVYFAVQAISTQELAAAEALERLADDAVGTFWHRADQEFSLFEQTTLHRLEAGGSPTEDARALHPLLRTALRFDLEANMTGPFLPPSSHTYPTEYLFHPLLIEARTASNHHSSRAISIHNEIVRSNLPAEVRGKAALDRAHLLIRESQHQEALEGLQAITVEFKDVTDPWGFQLSDLATLKISEILLQTQPSQARLLLRHLIESVMDEPWTIGQAGQSSIVGQALSWLSPLENRGWVRKTRSDLTSRTDMLYWSSLLYGELSELQLTQVLSASPGEIRWQQGPHGLWASTHWNQEIFALALDLNALLDNLKADAEAAVPSGSAIETYLVTPGSTLPSHMLAQRSLAPWLTEWSIVAVVRDPSLAEANQNRNRAQRISIIFLAITMMAFGAILVTRLIGRELEHARMKTNFAANVSHELRSPITQIRLKAESLLYGLADTPQEIEDHYTAIIRESERLSRLVENVLDYSAIDRDSVQLSLQPGSLEATVRRAIDGVRGSIEVRNMEIEVSIPSDLPTIHHDADAITQCIVNLISNAAKYSLNDPWIGVLGRLVEGGVEIAVSDRGIGIPASDLRHIFEPFYRSHDPLTRRQKGTGIGLTITKHIMESHGGGVSVQSRPGIGSTFCLRFPIDPNTE